jgi:hypothetical protein
MSSHFGRRLAFGVRARARARARIRPARSDGVLRQVRIAPAKQVGMLKARPTL